MSKTADELSKEAQLTAKKSEDLAKSIEQRLKLLQAQKKPTPQQQPKAFDPNDIIAKALSKASSAPKEKIIVPQPTVILQQEEEQQDEPMVEKEKQQKFILDEKGNLIDEQGNIMSALAAVKPVVSSLANQKRMQRRDNKKPMLKIERATVQEDSEFFDPTIKVAKTSRKRKVAEFHEQGDVIREAKRMRMISEYKQAHAEEMKLIEEKTVEETKAAATAKQIVVGETVLRLGGTDDVPNVEWWDAAILENDTSYDGVQDDGAVKIKEKVVAQAAIEHTEHEELEEDGPEVIMLTKKERRKIRHQTRVNREKEKQQQVKLGIIPPPPPKANLKNFMRVHLNDGTQDPTKLERMIRNQIQERIDAHEQRNQERALTKDERKLKNKKKHTEDANKELFIAAFRVTSVAHPKHQYKIKAQVAALFLTGCIMTSGNVNIIVAEGGSKAIRKFTNVLLKMNWNVPYIPKVADIQVTNEASNDAAPQQQPETTTTIPIMPTDNKCELMWKGSLKKRSFRIFKFQRFEDDNTARKYLQAHGISQFWELAQGTASIQADDANVSSSEDDEAVEQQDE